LLHDGVDVRPCGVPRAIVHVDDFIISAYRRLARLGQPLMERPQVVRLVEAGHHDGQCGFVAHIILRHKPWSRRPRGDTRVPRRFPSRRESPQPPWGPPPRRIWRENYRVAGRQRPRSHRPTSPNLRCPARHAPHGTTTTSPAPRTAELSALPKPPSPQP